jgi:hypothetical protein
MPTTLRGGLELTWEKEAGSNTMIVDHEEYKSSERTERVPDISWTSRRLAMANGHR